MEEEHAIHRVKCSPELNNEMISFSQIHCFDEKDVLIEEFEKWFDTSQIKHLIEIEQNILNRHKDNQDVREKIWKSIKYYYIKKYKFPKKKKEKPKRTNIRISHSLVEAIKEFLSKHMEKDKQFIPKNNYNRFYVENIESIEEEANRLIDIHKNLKFEDVTSKIKKNYNNQYYILKKKI